MTIEIISYYLFFMIFQICKILSCFKKRDRKNEEREGERQREREGEREREGGRERVFRVFVSLSFILFFIRVLVW